MELNLVIPKLSGVESEEIIKCKKAANNQWSDSFQINVIQEEGESYPAIFNSALGKLSSGYVLFLFPWVILKDRVFSDMPVDADLVFYGYERISWNQPELVQIEAGTFPMKEFAIQLHNHPGDITYTAIWNKVLSVDKIKALGLRFDESIKESYEYSFLLRYLSGCQNVVCSTGLIATFFTQPQLGLSAKERITEKIKLLNEYEQLLFRFTDESTASQIMDQERLNYITYERARFNETAASERSEAKDLLKEIRCQIKSANLKTDLMIKAKSAKGVLGNIKNYWCVTRKNEAKARSEQKEKEREAYLQENFYKRRALPRFFHKTFVKDKKILLYCESNTMKSHILNYYECVKGLENARFYIYYPSQWDNQVPEGVTLVQSERKALYTPWDLVVCADAKVPLYYRKCEAGILYINHGLHMISYDGGENLYAYAEGAGKFSAMFEPNKSYADIMSRDNEELVFHTGYKNAESLIAQKVNRDKYRKQLGFADDEIVVAVFGSWGPDSLFHKVGTALVQQAKDLMKEKYRFILSIHPREYKRYDETVEPLGNYIESLASEGFVVRNPKEPSIDYMVAADIIMCDYSSLCEEAMLTGKTVILSDFPTTRIWKNSIIANYQRKGVIFTKDGDLRALLEKCATDEEIRKYSKSLVDDLLPPEGGYQQAVRKATVKVLSLYN